MRQAAAFHAAQIEIMKQKRLAPPYFSGGLRDAG